MTHRQPIRTSRETLRLNTNLFSSYLPKRSTSDTKLTLNHKNKFKYTTYIENEPCATETHPMFSKPVPFYERSPSFRRDFRISLMLKRERQRLKTYILNNSKYVRLFGNKRYNDTNPLLFVNDQKQKTKLKTNGLIPVPNKSRKKIKTKSEEKELYELQRSIVMMRRYQYNQKYGVGSELVTSRCSFSDFGKLQKWYKNTQKIIRIQSTYRGYKIRKAVNEVQCFGMYLKYFDYLILKHYVFKTWWMLYRKYGVIKRKEIIYNRSTNYACTKRSKIISHNVICKVITLQNKIRCIISNNKYTNMLKRVMKYIHKKHICKDNFITKSTQTLYMKERLTLITKCFRKYIECKRRVIKKIILPYTCNKVIVSRPHCKANLIQKWFRRHYQFICNERERILNINKLHNNKWSYYTRMLVNEGLKRKMFIPPQRKDVNDNELKMYCGFKCKDNESGYAYKKRKRSNEKVIKSIQKEIKDKYHKVYMKPNESVCYYIDKVYFCYKTVNVIKFNNKLKCLLQCAVFRKRTQYKHYTLYNDNDVNNVKLIQLKYKKHYQYVNVRNIPNKQRALLLNYYIDKQRLYNNINDINKLIKYVKEYINIKKKFVSNKPCINNTFTTISKITLNNDNINNIVLLQRKIKSYLIIKHLKNALLSTQYTQINKHNGINRLSFITKQHQHNEIYSLSKVNNIQTVYKQYKCNKSSLCNYKPPRLTTVNKHYITILRLNDNKINALNILQRNIKKFIQVNKLHKQHLSKCYIKPINDICYIYKTRQNNINYITKNVNDSICYVYKTYIKRTVHDRCVSYINDTNSLFIKPIIQCDNNNVNCVHIGFISKCVKREESKLHIKRIQQNYKQHFLNENNVMYVHKSNSVSKEKNVIKYDNNNSKCGYMTKQRKASVDNKIDKINLIQQQYRNKKHKENETKQSSLMHNDISNKLYQMKLTQHNNQNDNVKHIDKNISKITKVNLINTVPSILKLQQTIKQTHLKEKTITQSTLQKQQTPLQPHNNSSSNYISKHKITLFHSKPKPSLSFHYITKRIITNTSSHISSLSKLQHNIKHRIFKSSLHKSTLSSLQVITSSNNNNLTLSFPPFIKPKQIPRNYTYNTYTTKTHLHIIKPPLNISFITLLSMFFTKNIQEYVFIYLKHNSPLFDYTTDINALSCSNKSLSFPLTTLKRLYRFFNEHPHHNSKVKTFFHKVFPPNSSTNTVLPFLANVTAVHIKQLNNYNIYSSIEPDLIVFVNEFAKYDKGYYNDKFINERIKQIRITNTNVFALVRLIDDEYANFVFGNYCMKCYAYVKSCKCSKNESECSDSGVNDNNSNNNDDYFDSVSTKNVFGKYNSTKAGSKVINRKPKTVEEYEDPITHFITANTHTNSNMKGNENENVSNISDELLNNNSNNNVYKSKQLMNKNISDLKEIIHNQTSRKNRNNVTIKHSSTPNNNNTITNSIQ